MGERNKRPSVEEKSVLLEPIPALGFLLGPCDYSTSALFECLPVTELVCISVCVLDTCSTKFVYVLMLVWLASTEWGIRIIKTSHMGTSGCDWQEKKGSLCSGNWQQKPDPTQYNPAQYSTEPANTGRKNTNSRTAPLHPSLHPDSWPILIIPQQSPWQLFFPYTNTVQTSPIPSISI